MFAPIMPGVWATGVLLSTPWAARPESATGPLAVCAANPRYFADSSGEPVYLAGAHDGWELQDYAWGDRNPGVLFDWSGLLDFLVAHEHNVIRMWVVEHTKINDDDQDLTTPMPYERVAGNGEANDGEGKFDLDRFSEAFFQRLRSRTAEARHRGLYVIVMLFQGWSIEDKGGRVNPWPYHPFHAANNVNAVNGDLNGDGQGTELHTWLGDDHPITERQRAYVRQVVDTVNDLDNVLYEIANESSAYSTQWQYRTIDYIHEYEREKPTQHPVGMTFQHQGGSNAALFESPADWISPNREGGYRHSPPPADGRKDGCLAHQRLPTDVIRVDGDGGITQDGLRTGGRHLDELGRALSPFATAPFPLGSIPIVVEDGIADMPEVAGPLLGLHLQVRDRAGATRAPVDQVRAAVDHSLLVEAHERGAHSVAQALVERKALPLPVARDTQPLVLLGDAPQGFVGPGPAAFDELFPAQIVTGEPLLAQFSLYHVLSSDACVIRAGQKKSLTAIHSIVTGHQVLDSGGHSVTQVQDASHVGRGHGDAPAWAVRRGPAQLDLRFGAEVALLFPPPIETFFVLSGIVGLGKFVGHRPLL